jgi:protein subunit release factor A
VTLYHLPAFMDGDLEDMIGALQKSEMEERMAEAGMV